MPRPTQIPIEATGMVAIVPWMYGRISGVESIPCLTRKPSLPYATALAIARKSSTLAIIPAFRGGVWRARRNTTKGWTLRSRFRIACTWHRYLGSTGRFAWGGVIPSGCPLTRYENTAAPAGVAMTEPKRYANRIVEITVGRALDGVGRSAWVIERYDCCNCPDCEQQYHWLGTGGWHETRTIAELYLKGGKQ